MVAKLLDELGNLYAQYNLNLSKFSPGFLTQQ